MKYQVIAWMVAAFFGSAVVWIKANGGKISAWLRVVGSICKFTADMNDTCADGKAEPEEMQRLCTDWNQLMSDLGLLKKGVLEKMKKPIIAAVLALFAVCLTIPAHADIFPPIGESPKAKVSEPMAIPGVDPGTIIADAAQIAATLGTKEGGMYDFNRHEYVNYAAATLITYAPYGLSLDFGVLNTDGVAASIDWNIGGAIPHQDAPLLSFFQYVYVGFGVGERYTDINDGNGSNWRFAYGPTAEFKLTF